MPSPIAPFLQSPPLGARLPNSLHAVSCSIPTMADVIGYEEKRPETIARIGSGYPRFVTHFHVRRMHEEWRTRLGLEGRDLFLTASETAAADLLAFVEDEEARLVGCDGIFCLHAAAGSSGAARAKAFLQHSGSGISSRLAEDYLWDLGLIFERQEEELWAAEGAEGRVRNRVAESFGTGSENVFLATSGMNAFYAVFRAIQEVQAKRGRDLWIQLGWLYVDTIEVLRKMVGGSDCCVAIPDVLDFAAVETLLREKGDRIAGIVTETPTNPLIQTADVARLRELTERAGIPLVLDPTLASPLNIDVLRFADVAVNSLTKYAASEGDVMMGAAVLNPESRWAEEIREGVARRAIPPYLGDLRRLAVELENYSGVMAKINRNTVELVRFLEGHPAVESVHWAYSGESGENYAKLQRRPNSPGGLVSVKLRLPMAQVFDRLQLAKGLSFGVVFSLACPFLYLAHYDLVSTAEGRETLFRHGIDPELIRISVGTEEIGDIIATFEKAFSG